MLLCSEVVTIARCDGGSWRAETVSGASWYSRTVGAMTDRGLQAGREIHCRIPAAAAPETLPIVGDYLILGEVEAIGSLRDLQGADFGKITNVSDNRRGPEVLRHIALVAL